MMRLLRAYWAEENTGRCEGAQKRNAQRATITIKERVFFNTRRSRDKRRVTLTHTLILLRLLSHH